MDELLVHQKTAAAIKSIIKSRPHAILVVGQAGAGKSTLALRLAAALLNVEPAKIADYPYLFRLQKSKNKEISIDDVRQLTRALQLKTPGTNTIRRVAIIESAEAMGHAAQNSLLKLLEEPPEDTVLILIAPGPSSLLPTIVSRARVLEVHPPTLEQASQFFKPSASTSIGSAWHLSQGAAGMMSALLRDTDHPLKIAATEFKSFLQMNQSERLKALEPISKNKDDFMIFLDAGRRVLSALQAQAASKNNVNLSQRITKARKLLYESQGQLSASSSTRLIELNVALNLAI